jgi:Arc/MetJ-type ribon-helix-helix transcriptional regulator
MNLSLPDEIQKLIEKRLKSGEYRTAEEVVSAAIQSFDVQNSFGDFEAGEMDALLAEGERSAEEEGTLDGEEAFRQREQRRAVP